MILLLALACATDPAPPPTTIAGTGIPIGTDVPMVPTMLGEVPGVAFTGDWTSTGCAGRSFARNLRFENDNSYAGIDLVSPCPLNTQCVWSGIVGYAGIWKQEGNKLLLREIGAPTAPGSPHPTEVTSTVDGTLMENGCTYTRGLTVPDGLTEDQVRPNIPR
ncbi:MAG: hypothetical protein Q8P41_21795 [Pseudomonadota bacterium]|nr:hypothetical protein [Pseudomonadota bacterium]